MDPTLRPEAPAAAVGGLLLGALRASGRFLLRVPLALALVLPVGWALVIWDLSSQSRPVKTSESFLWEFASNLAHAPLFGLLTLFLAAVLLRERGGGWPHARGWPRVLVFACTLGYAVLDEIHQSHTPGRHASAGDVVTDVVAALQVLWIVTYLGRPGASEPGLVRRLAVGGLLCVASALLATLS